jgi:type II secretory pathway predicted ATPase ExeA
MNYDFDSRALLSLILVGLPELELRLGGKHNRALYTRLHVRIRVPALTVADSEAYLAYRLTRVGARADVFQPDAIDRLHDATQGGMRELDRVATDALKLGAERRRPRVDAQTVDDVIDRLELPRSPR